ncbi:MAG TPA: hypothetical protein VIZ70_04750 [Propionibacteriaceae bacterium]
MAQGRDGIRTECAGTIAGWWFAAIGKRGEDLIAAGLLMLAGHVDLDELDRWIRIGWERNRGTLSRTAQPANSSMWCGSAAVSFQVLRRHCPEPARLT